MLSTYVRQLVRVAASMSQRKPLAPKGPAVVAFGQRVRARRQHRGLSQERLADAAGMHRTYIGLVERGEVNPTLETILAIAKALESSPQRLVADLHRESG